MGCCGSKSRTVEYKVTFRDGRTETFSSAMAANVAAAQDSSEQANGGPKSPTVRAVRKAGA